MFLEQCKRHWFKKKKKQTNKQQLDMDALDVIQWAIVFLTGIWNLWLHKNAIIFSNKYLNPRLQYLSQAMEILPIYPQTMHLQPGLLCLWNGKHLWFNTNGSFERVWDCMCERVQQRERERLKNLWIWYYAAHSVMHYNIQVSYL